MTRIDAQEVTGRDFYSGLYRQDLQSQAQWLQLTAHEKVTTLETLLKRSGLRPRSLLELGCGTGAVITECQHRGLASEYTAIDYSKDAIEYLAANSTGIECLASDITDPSFRIDRCFDVVVLSHVLEHLEDPLACLQSLIDKIDFRYLVAEVPLEDLAIAQLKNMIRDRTRNSAGHVQFFKPSTFRALLSAASLEVKDSRVYVPILTPGVAKWVCKRDGMSPFRTITRMCTTSFLPMLLLPVWKRFCYSHYGALCVRRPAGA